MGAFVSLPLDEAEALIERISTNTSFWYNKRDHKVEMYEVSDRTMNDAKVEAMSYVIKRLQVMVEKMGKQPQPCMALALYCDICGGSHGTMECTSFIKTTS